MIKFETIRWKNFLSTGDQFTEVFLTKRSSTLIVGTNGAGKSTILDALCFVLFNKPFRKINKPQLVNSINGKGTVVEVEFVAGGKKYMIRRGIKPGIFEIYENDKLVDQDAANRDYQKHLEQNVLKLNYKSFTQVVILGSSTFVPFMQLPAASRREVIEDLLDINVFSIMNTLLKDRMTDLKQRENDCQHMLHLSEEKLKLQQSNIKNLELVNEDRVNEKLLKVKTNEDKIKDNQQRCTGFDTEIGQLQSTIANVDSLTTKLDSLKEIKFKLNDKSSSVDRDIKFFEKNATCPVCTQDLSDSFREDKTTKLSTKKIELNNALEELSTTTDSVVDQLTEIKKTTQLITALQKDKGTLERDIVKLEFDNLQLNKDIIDLQTNTPKIAEEKEKYEALSKEYSDTKKNCAEVSKQGDEFKVVSSLLKDTGIKSLIIKEYIPVVNKLINKYLHSMDFYVNFTLDENFNEKIMSRSRDNFTYSSFSEGEKQKIDLALLFTWREVARLKNSAATNLLILDEVFDSSLDDSSTSELLKILNGMGQDSNIFVISHKGEILVDRFQRTLQFEKINDFSKLTVDK